jgi:cobyric acid synthase CobQ/L-threonine-O-3-phosphate decarboxylase
MDDRTPRFSRRLDGLQVVPHGGIDPTELASYLLKPQETLDLSANIHAYGPPDSIYAAIQRVNLEHYPDIRATALRDSIAQQVQIVPDSILVGNGSVELIYLLAQACLDPGDTALVCGPTFGEYTAACCVMGAKVIESNTKPEHNFAPDLAEITQIIHKQQPHLVFICNPNNPTGRLWTEHEIKAVLEATNAIKGILVLDESYYLLADADPQTNQSTKLLAANNIFILRSLTKTFAVPGLRLGYAITTPIIAQAITTMRLPWSVNTFAQEIGKQLLAETEYVQKVRQHLAGDKKYLLERLNAIQASFWPSAANFVLIKVGNATECKREFLKQKVLVRDCTSFGLPEYIRVAVKTAAATDKLIELLESWQIKHAHPEKKDTQVLGRRKITPAKTLMILGTASSVGKTTVVAGLCRLFKQRGLSVAPFKAQNMALNSAVAKEGGEIGRAQAMQAEAAGLEPSIYMNPILLKPEGEARSQVIVQGKVQASLSARDYYKLRQEMLGVVEESLAKLRAEHDLVIIEGAGSPVEMNLKASDIVNMRVAKLANSPVILVSDIDRGGVFASIVGTLALLEPDEQALVRGLIVNKFRGDPTLFEEGVHYLQEKTGKPVLGVLPYYRNIKLPEEDSVALESKLVVSPNLRKKIAQTELDVEQVGQKLNIAIILLPHIANFDDFDGLESEEGVEVRYIRELFDLGAPDMVIIPGTKTTIADLQFIVERGLDKAIATLAAAGTPIMGICGGYQMLGQRIDDPEHVESHLSSVRGLGLLPVQTSFIKEKATYRVNGTVTATKGLLEGLHGMQVNGYEIHMGRTTPIEDDNPPTLVQLTRREDEAIDQPDGFLNERGTVWGTYLHGLLNNDNFRHALLTVLLKRKGFTPKSSNKGVSNFKQFSSEAEYNKLAELLRSNLNMQLLQELAGI